MEQLSLRKNKGHLLLNDNENKDIFKLELEERRLTLRKNEINNIIFSKRKMGNQIEIENVEENIKKYKIGPDDINISDKFKIDILSFHNNVRQYT